MKTFVAFVAGCGLVATLCAASSPAKKWEIRAYTGWGVGSEPESDKLVTRLLPDDAEVLGTSVVADRLVNRVVIIYRIPKK